MAEQPGDKMTLNMEAELKWKPGSTGPEEFSMVVTVQGPPEVAKEPPRAVRGPGTGVVVDAEGRGVDLVAVLDISDSMTADKLKDMKQAMYLVISKLGERDRLSIVSFNDEVKLVMPLTELAKANAAKVQNREVARSTVEKLEAGGDAKVNGTDKESEAKSLAAKILEERVGEQKDRVGRVIFLSKGDDDADAGKTNKARPETAADMFLLGAGDSLREVPQSDAKGSVAVAFAKQSVDKMASSISGLKSSVDTGRAVQLELEALEGVDICGIESGRNGLSLTGGAQKRITVFIPAGVAAGGHKTFTMSLKVHDTKTTHFVCATGWLKGSNPKDEEDYDRFDYKLMKVEPRLPPPPPCWQARLANLLVPSPSPAPPPSPSPPPSASASPPPKKIVDGSETPSEAEVEEEETIVISRPVTQPKVKIISNDGPDHPRRWAWLSGWKKPELGTGLLSMLQIIVIPDSFTKIKWSKTYSWALAVLLLGVGVAMLINSIPAPPPPPPPPPPPMPDLDISQHPGWPKMEESIALITLKKMDEARITSSLRGASIEEISSALNRYIYQALVHDTGLHVSLLEETVQTLEEETQELRVNVEKLAKEKAQKVDKKVALERANDTIADLERQLAGLLEEKKEAT